MDAHEDEAQEDAAGPPPTAATPHGPPCPGCGRFRTEDDARGVAWSSRHAPDGAVSFVCPDCTRAELQDIEVGIEAGFAAPPRAARSPAA
jgi:hypothetical protein